MTLLWFTSFWLGTKWFSYAQRPAPPLASSTVLKPKPNPAPTPAPPVSQPQPAAPAPTQTAKPKAQAKPAPAPAPTSEIAPESACPGQSSLTAVASVLACMAAYARTYNKISSIASNSQLVAAAEAKVNDMASCGYSHTACGREADYWIEAKGYGGNCTGENIAQGQTTPRDVFISWMNSSGHRANILRPEYKHIGAATASGSSGRLWAMELGGC